MTSSKRRAPHPGAPPDAPGGARARVSAHLARTGAKHSRARDVIVDAFLGSPGHLSAEELTDIVRRHHPGIGHTTVYRTLKLLSECGVAEPHRFGERQTRYERAAEQEHHDHLICTSCGAILEFSDPTIEAHQRDIARRHGFDVATHRMELYGTCAGCLAARRHGDRVRPARTPARS